MLKRKILLTILPILGIQGFAQAQNYFEGKITFESDCKVKASNIDIRKLRAILGVGSVLFFKNGNYYHQYDGGSLEFDLYNRDENKVYVKRRNNDTIYWSDCVKPGSKILDFKFAAKKEKVLGIICDQMTIRYKDHTQIHYYNSESTPLNPEWFKNFVRNDENLIDEKEKAIFIKSETEYDKYVIISTAKNISREKIDASIFKIPAGSILVERK